MIRITRCRFAPLNRKSLSTFGMESADRLYVNKWATIRRLCEEAQTNGQIFLGGRCQFDGCAQGVSYAMLMH